MDSIGRIGKRTGQDSSFVPVVAVETTASGSRSVTRPPPTPVVYADPQESIRASALPNGEKALTPIIAGTISGTCIAIAWLVALVVALLKRHRRKRRFAKMLAGVPGAERTSDLEKVGNDGQQEPVIIPPDPAIVLGVGKPGEYVLGEKENVKGKGKMRERIPIPAVFNNANSCPTRVDVSPDERPNSSQPGGSEYLSPTWTRDNEGAAISTAQRPLNDGKGSTRRSRRMSTLEGVTEEDYAYRSRPFMPRIRSGQETTAPYDNSDEPRHDGADADMHLRGGVEVDQEIDEIMVVQSPTELESESSRDLTNATR